jgi:hypothetical protein
MIQIRKTISLILLVAALSGSCAGQPPESPTPDINSILTQSVGTIAVQFFQTQTAMVTPATPTPVDTPTPIPTATPLAPPSPIASPTVFYTAIVYPSITPTGTQYTPTVNPSTLAYGCNNLGLIRDVTIPAGTEVQPNEHLTKTWQVANTGTCDWLFGYRVGPVSGDSLAQDSVRVSGNSPVPKGEWRQVSVSFSAPEDPGTYIQYWQMNDGAGHSFGSLLAISIVVESPASYP